MNLKRIVLSFLLLSLVALLPSCARKQGVIVGSSKVVSQAHKIEAVSALKAYGGIKVTVVQGAGASCTVQGQDNVLPHVRFEQQGGELSVGLDRRYAYVNADVTVTLYTPYLSKLVLSGGSRAVFKGQFAGSSFTADLSGAAEAEGLTLQTATCRVDLSGASGFKGSVAANDLSVTSVGASEAVLTARQVRRLTGEISGASQMTLSGTAGQLRLELSGSSSCTAQGLSVQTARVEASGASKASVNAQKELAYELSGSSTLKDYGRARVTSESASGSSKYVHVSGR